MITKRGFKQKLIFKLVRLPIPWRIRKLINKFLAIITFKYIKTKKSNELNSLLLEGNFITNTESLNLDINYEKIQIKAKNLPLYEQWDRSNKDFFFKDIKKGINTAVVIMDQELEHITEEIGEVLRNSNLVKSYFNAVPKLDNKTIWWSMPDNDEREAQFWHRDIDNIYFLKCFIYITDVDEESGPHFYINKSHRSNTNLKFKRYQDEDLINNGYKVPLKGLTGSKGTLIFEDTFGFHRGSSPKNNKVRCILQYQFSLFKNP